MDTKTTATRIRVALRTRSGKPWSVRRSRGTARGWITITRHPGESLTEPDRQELASLLGLESVHFQGVRIPAGHDYYQEYVDRAEGRTPSVIGTPYWD